MIDRLISILVSNTPDIKNPYCMNNYSDYDEFYIEKLNGLEYCLNLVVYSIIITILSSVNIYESMPLIEYFVRNIENRKLTSYDVIKLHRDLFMHKPVDIMDLDNSKTLNGCKTFSTYIEKYGTYPLHTMYICLLHILNSDKYKGTLVHGKSEYVFKSIYNVDFDSRIFSDTQLFYYLENKTDNLYFHTCLGECYKHSNDEEIVDHIFNVINHDYDSQPYKGITLSSIVRTLLYDKNGYINDYVLSSIKSILYFANPKKNYKYSCNMSKGLYNFIDYVFLEELVTMRDFPQKISPYGRIIAVLRKLIPWIKSIEYSEIRGLITTPSECDKILKPFKIICESMYPEYDKETKYQYYISKDDHIDWLVRFMCYCERYKRYTADKLQSVHEQIVSETRFNADQDIESKLKYIALSYFRYLNISNTI